MAQVQSASEVITAVVSPRSLGHVLLFEATDQDVLQHPSSFNSSPEDTRNAVRELQKLGFTIHSVSEATVSISGDKQLFQDVFGRKLKKDKSELAPEQEIEFYAVTGDQPVLSAPGDLGNLIEGIALAKPPTLFCQSVAAFGARSGRCLPLPVCAR